MGKLWPIGLVNEKVLVKGLALESSALASCSWGARYQPSYLSFAEKRYYSVSQSFGFEAGQSQQAPQADLIAYFS